MKAARLHTFGSALNIDDVDEPDPQGDDVVVDVKVAAVNPLDLWVAEGSVAGGSQPLPMALGTEGVAEYEGRRVIVNGFGLGVAGVAPYVPGPVKPDWDVKVPSVNHGLCRIAGDPNPES